MKPATHPPLLEGAWWRHDKVADNDVPSDVSRLDNRVIELKAAEEELEGRFMGLILERQRSSTLEEPQEVRRAFLKYCDMSAVAGGCEAIVTKGSRNPKAVALMKELGAGKNENARLFLAKQFDMTMPQWRIQARVYLHSVLAERARHFDFARLLELEEVADKAAKKAYLRGYLEQVSPEKGGR